MQTVIYKQKYIDSDSLQEIKLFYTKLGDTFSSGPKTSSNKNAPYLGKQGCWDKPLRLEISHNPLNKVIDRLKEDFGEFHIHTSSIRYLGYPFTPHSDIRNNEWLLENKKKYRMGYTMLIPLWWKKDHVAGTAFFDSPPLEDQKLYIQEQQHLPRFKDDQQAKNFGVRKLIRWQSPGDLVAWKNFMFHCSMTGPEEKYDDENYTKEFISIETFFPK